MDRPMGFWPGSDFRTSASFTIATGGLSAASPSLKSRPLFNGIPSAAKAPGATTSMVVLGAVAHSCCGGR